MPSRTLLRLPALMLGALLAGCTCCPTPPEDATPVLHPDGTAVLEERDGPLGKKLQCPVWNVAGCQPGTLAGCPAAPVKDDDGRPVVEDNGRPVVDDNGCQKYKGKCAPMPDNGRPVVDDHITHDGATVWEDNGRPVVDDIGCQYFEGHVCPARPDGAALVDEDDDDDGDGVVDPDTDELGCQAYTDQACPAAAADSVPLVDEQGVIKTTANGCPQYSQAPGGLPACPKAPIGGIPVIREGELLRDAIGCPVFTGRTCAVAPDKGSPHLLDDRPCPTYRLDSQEYCSPAPDNGRPIVDDNGRPVVDDETGCLTYQAAACPSAPDNGRPIVDDNGRPIVDDSGCQVYAPDEPVPAPLCDQCEWCTCP